MLDISQISDCRLQFRTFQSIITTVGKERKVMVGMKRKSWESQDRMVKQQEVLKPGVLSYFSTLCFSTQMNWLSLPSGLRVTQTQGGSS